MSGGHRHRAAHVSDALPYFGSVSRRRPNPAAHGGCRYIETCRCGARREELINGDHVETGEWIASEDS